MPKHILALDYSTSATGWAKLDLQTMTLLSYGVMLPDFKNPKKSGIPAFKYPELQVLKLERLSEQLLALIDDDTEVIVIEEINGGSRAGRLSQKVLDAGHFLFLRRLPKDMLSKVIYVDSDGSDGWRSRQGLKLQLSDFDKQTNKERKKLNKKLGKGQEKLPMITQKTLACRFVNKCYGLNLDCDQRETDGDIADAIGLLTFYAQRYRHDREA